VFSMPAEALFIRMWNLAVVDSTGGRSEEISRRCTSHGKTFAFKPITPVR